MLQTHTLLSNRCICGKLKQKHSPICVQCYRRIDKKCRVCLNHEIFCDSEENEYYDVCKLHKMTDLERLQCQEHLNLRNDRRMHKRVIDMIDYYNQTKQFYGHYVQIKTGILVVFEYNSGHWDYNFYQLEHYTKEVNRIG